MTYSPLQYQQELEDGTRRPSGAIKLKELSGKHLRAINLHMSGAKGREIAREMDMTEAWVSVVLNDPLAQAEIRKRFVEVDNEMFAKATLRISQMMDGEDPALVLRSAEMVWRARGRFEKRGDDRPTAEDIVGNMMKMIEENGGQASVTIKAEVKHGPPTLEG